MAVRGDNSRKKRKGGIIGDDEAHLSISLRQSPLVASPTSSTSQTFPVIILLITCNHFHHYYNNNSYYYYNNNNNIICQLVFFLTDFAVGLLLLESPLHHNVAVVFFFLPFSGFVLVDVIHQMTKHKIFPVEIFPSSFIHYLPSQFTFRIRISYISCYVIFC